MFLSLVFAVPCLVSEAVGEYLMLRRGPRVPSSVMITMFTRYWSYNIISPGSPGVYTESYKEFKYNLWANLLSSLKLRNTLCLCRHVYKQKQKKVHPWFWLQWEYTGVSALFSASLLLASHWMFNVWLQIIRGRTEAQVYSNVLCN